MSDEYDDDKQYENDQQQYEEEQIERNVKAKAENDFIFFGIFSGFFNWLFK